MLKRVFEFIASFTNHGQKEDWIIPKGDVRFYLVERNSIAMEL